MEDDHRYLDEIQAELQLEQAQAMSDWVHLLFLLDVRKEASVSLIVLKIRK